jgi:hypothetical protein
VMPPTQVRKFHTINIYVNIASYYLLNFKETDIL